MNILSERINNLSTSQTLAMAAECELPYYEFKTTRAAIASHFKHLKELGKQPQLA